MQRYQLPSGSHGASYEILVPVYQPVSVTRYIMAMWDLSETFSYISGLAISRATFRWVNCCTKSFNLCCCCYSEYGGC